MGGAHSQVEAKLQAPPLALVVNDSQNATMVQS